MADDERPNYLSQPGYPPSKLVYFDWFKTIVPDDEGKRPRFTKATIRGEHVSLVREKKEGD